MITGTINEYLDEVAHLAGMRENEPLHMPSEDDYFTATGRVLLRPQGENTVFSLKDGDAPVALTTFLWSAYHYDAIQNTSLTQFFDSIYITGACPWDGYRIRGIVRTGYLQAFYTRPPTNPTYGYSYLLPSHGGFIQESGGWRLDSGFSGGYFGTNSLFNYSWFNNNETHFRYGAPGYSPDLWFPIGFQLELGYGSWRENYEQREATRFWPAFGAPIKTDYPQYRGYDPTWCCYAGGLANAPHVPNDCPNKNLSYTAPPEPEDE